MKITEIANVTKHPAVAKEAEFTTLLQSGDEASDDIIAFIMDDNNADARRLYMLRHLDELMGDVQDSYSESDLQDFMYDPPEPAKERHLRVVEMDGEDTPTGEYELCQNCYGEGCDECEEGLIDVTGTFKLPDFDE